MIVTPGNERPASVQLVAGFVPCMIGKRNEPSDAGQVQVASYASEPMAVLPVQDSLVDCGLTMVPSPFRYGRSVTEPVGIVERHR